MDQAQQLTKREKYQEKNKAYGQKRQKQVPPVRAPQHVATADHEAIRDPLAAIAFLRLPWLHRLNEISKCQSHLASQERGEIWSASSHVFSKTMMPASPEWLKP